MKCLVCGHEHETDGKFCYYCGSVVAGDWDTAEGRVDIFERTLRIAKAGYYDLPEKTVKLPREPEGYQRAIYIKDDEGQTRPLKVTINDEAKSKRSVICADSFEAAESLAVHSGDAIGMKPPLVLNFANPHFPGGGVAGGAKAQEEDLCRRSTLCLSLTSDDAAAFYAANKATGDCVFTNDMILSPHVAVFRDSAGVLLHEPFEVAVLTVSAPYAKGIPDSERDGLDEIIEKRVEAMLRAATLYGYDRLILGAWGCGAFGNDPEVVAYAFYKVIDRMERFGQSDFTQIVFAVPDKESVNYKTFERILVPTSILPVIELEEENAVPRKSGQLKEDVLPGRELNREITEKPGSRDLNSISEEDASRLISSEANLKRFEFDFNDCYIVDSGPRLEVTVTDDIDVGDVVELKLTGNIVKTKTKNYEKNGLFEFTGMNLSGSKELCFDREDIERKINCHGLWPGDVLGERYRILEEIGRGVFGRILLATDSILPGKCLAIREVEINGVDPAGHPAKSALDRAVHLLSKLDHPNIVDIYDAIETDDYAYIVLNYVEGQLLSELLKEEGPQGEEDVLNWMLQLCDALSYLHRQDPPIVYRNIKPSSIMLRPDGRVILISFGIAREHKAGQTCDTIAFGTEGFAAPEAYGAEQTDARSDIYSLGATMWNLLTGEAPPGGFPLPNVREHLPEYAPRVSDAFADVIIPKCTAIDRADRYQSCEELAYDLMHVDDLNQMIRNRRRGLFGRFRGKK